MIYISFYKYFKNPDKNIYKDLNSTYNMPKKNNKKTYLGPKERLKAETTIVKGTITKDQRIILQKLIGIIGSNEQDVVGKILTLWLYNEGFLNNNVKKEEKAQ